jgi:hypothetical protein
MKRTGIAVNLLIPFVFLLSAGISSFAQDNATRIREIKQMYAEVKQLENGEVRSFQG